MSDNIAGYQVYQGHRLLGQLGIAYNYIMAGNGLFIESKGRYVSARIPISGNIDIHGLPALNPHITMHHGRIPGRFFDLALSVMLARPEVEVYIGIARDEAGYRLVIPDQETGPASVRYQVPSDVVVDLHSHGAMGPGFSSIDNKDDQGLRIYGVVGDLLDDKPSVNLRIGVYGYFMPVRWEDVFEGTLAGVTDIYGLDEIQGKDKGKYKGLGPMARQLLSGRGLPWPRR